MIKITIFHETLAFDEHFDFNENFEFLKTVTV